MQISGTNSDNPPLVERLAYIDGLRALAVIVVVLFHAGDRSGLTGVAIWILALGKLGVDLFLVLSGFCLFWPLVKSGSGAIKPLELKVYAKRRFRRIAPPFYAALLINILVSYFIFRISWRSEAAGEIQKVFPWNGQKSWIDLFSHLTLLHGLVQGCTHTFDGAFWSLSLEWQFYFLLPIIVWIARRSSVLLACGFVFAVTIGFRTAVKIIDPGLIWVDIWNENGLSRWAEFACGVAVAAYSAGAFSAAASQFFKMIGHIFSVTALWCLVIFLMLKKPNFYLHPILWGLACGSLVIAAKRPGGFRRFLEHPLLVRLGTISYSVYLIHGSVFQLVAILLIKLNASPSIRTITNFAVAFLLVPVVSILFFLLFEKPFLNPTPKNR